MLITCGSSLNMESRTLPDKSTRIIVAAVAIKSSTIHKSSTLYACRQSDSYNASKDISIKPQFLFSYPNRLIRFDKFYKKEYRTYCIGNHRRNCYSVYRHLQHNYKKQVQGNIQHTGYRQRFEWHLRLSNASENCRLKVVK